MGHAFISYAHQDLALATRLERALRDARVDVWRDREGIRPGEVFEPVLSRGLAQANAVLVLVSKTSVKSSWVSWETEHALSRRVPVIPVLIDGTAPVGRLGKQGGVDLHDWRPEVPHAELTRLIAELRRVQGAKGRAGGWQVSRLGPGRLEVVLDHQRHLLEVQQGQLFVNGQSTGPARAVVTNERHFVFQLQDGATWYPAELLVVITMFRGDPKHMTLTVGGRTLYKG